MTCMAQVSGMNPCHVDQVRTFLIDNSVKSVALFGARSVHFARDFYLRDSPTDAMQNGDFRVVFATQYTNYTEVLLAISRHIVLTSLLAVCSADTAAEKRLIGSLANFKQHSMFYLLLNSKWSLISTLASGSAWSNVHFHAGSMLVKEQYDFRGLTVKGISLPWEPFLFMVDCDDEGICADVGGFIKDYVDILAKRCNFTVDLRKQVDGDWGTAPKSGPFNASGVFGGVMGGVVNGEYDLSPSFWLRNLQRDPLMSFVAIKHSKVVLVWLPKPSSVDMGLFVRPFVTDSWIVIACFTLTIMGSIIAVHILIKDEGILHTIAIDLSSD